jgi:hypothetical protein
LVKRLYNTLVGLISQNNRDVLSAFLESGVSPNIQSEGKPSLLVEAVLSGYYPVVEVLMDYGACFSGYDFTLFDREMIKELLSSGIINESTTTGISEKTFIEILDGECIKYCVEEGKIMPYSWFAIAMLEDCYVVSDFLKPSFLCYGVGGRVHGVSVENLAGIHQNAVFQDNNTMHECSGVSSFYQID